METVSLGELTKLCYRYPTFYGFDYQAAGVLVLKGENISRDGELIEVDSPDYITEEIHAGFPRTHLEAGDLVVSVRGEVGKVGLVPDHLAGSNINANTIRIALLKRARGEEFTPEFLWFYLNSGPGQLLIRQFIAGGVQETITAPELLKVQIPKLDFEIQKHLVATMDAARAERKAKLVEADVLLTGLDGFLLDVLRVSPLPRPKTIFAVQAKDLTGVMNPSRYRGLQLEKYLSFKSALGDISSLLKNKITPAKDAPEEQFDWIRIDDLPNQPWQVEIVRTEVGKNITGTFFEVQEHDILISRLGPTILNAKFVLCPKLVKRTIASGEFLVLRCNQEYHPEAVLWLLRTALYREIMYLRSRGATPSRFRLDGGDLLTIPFPRMNFSTQSTIVAEVRRRRVESRRLRTEAEAGWQAAKRWFEEQLLGSAAP